jgi:hypothetical protein
MYKFLEDGVHAEGLDFPGTIPLQELLAAPFEEWSFQGWVPKF